MFAAFIFTVLQGLLFQQGSRRGYSGWSMLAIVFAAAGALVVGGAVAVLRRRGVRQVARALGVQRGRSWQITCKGAVLWAVPAVLVALGHQALLRQVDWFGRWTEAHGRSFPLLLGSRDKLWCALMVVCAAPLIEEVIFRGMIYRSLRAKWGLAFSLFVSSALFATAHPMSHAVPVSLMAICAAMAFESTGSLLAAMAVHAAYNGCVLLFAQ